MSKTTNMLPANRHRLITKNLSNPTSWYLSQKLISRFTQTERENLTTDQMCPVTLSTTLRRGFLLMARLFRLILMKDQARSSDSSEIYNQYFEKNLRQPNLK